jgi:hypothetical protein
VYLICVTQLNNFFRGRVVVPLSGETRSYFYTLWLYTIHQCSKNRKCHLWIKDFMVSYLVHSNPIYHLILIWLLKKLILAIYNSEFLNFILLVDHCLSLCPYLIGH